MLVGTRHQCPLMAGIGDGETSWPPRSPPSPARPGASSYIEDGEIVARPRDAVRVVDADGESLERDDVRRAVGRRDRREARLRDLHAQGDPRAARRGRRDPGAQPRATARSTSSASATSISPTCAACSSSRAGPRTTRAWSAATASRSGPASPARSGRERVALPPPAVTPARSSSASRSRARPRTRSPACVRRAECGAPTLAITNSPGSQITREADAVLLHPRRDRDRGRGDQDVHLPGRAAVPVRAAARGAARDARRGRAPGAAGRAARRCRRRSSARSSAHADVGEIAERHRRQAVLLLLGRHVGLPVCLEGALKLKEISYIHDRGLRRRRDEARADRAARRRDAGRLRRHRQPVADKLASNLQEMRARAAQVIAVATEVTTSRRARRRRPLGPAHQPAAAAGCWRWSRSSCSPTTSPNSAASTSTSRATWPRR